MTMLQRSEPNDLTAVGAAPPSATPVRPLLRQLHLDALNRFLDDLLAATGVRFAIHDIDGRALAEEQGGADPEEQGSWPKRPDGDAVTRLIAMVADSGRHATDESPLGVMTLVVPVRLRRRLAAVAVGCYMTVEALRSPQVESLAEARGTTVDEVRRQFADRAVHSRSCADRLADTVALLFGLKEDEIIKEREICELTENLLNSYEEISLLYKISTSISVSSSPMEIMDLIISELLHVLDVEAVAAVEAAPAGAEPGSHRRALSAGEPVTDQQGLGRLYQLYVEHGPSDGRPYIENNFAATRWANRFPGIRNLMITPLVYQRETLSVLMTFNKRDVRGFESNDAKLVASIAGESAVHLKNSRLYEDLRDLLYNVIRALSSAIDAKDPYTCGHSERVAFIARSIAERLHLPPTEVESVYLSGLLHDVGKIGISEDVLRKPGKLTDDEMDHVRSHPEIGARILGSLKQLDDILPGVRHHHERIDGKGYPLGLKGEEIPLIGRIICVADGYDSMTSDRPYRSAMPEEKVFGELRRCSGSQFDPEIVDVLFSLLDEPHFHEIYENMAGGIRDGEGTS